MCPTFFSTSFPSASGAGCSRLTPLPGAPAPRAARPRSLLTRMQRSDFASTPVPPHLHFTLAQPTKGRAGSGGQLVGKLLPSLQALRLEESFSGRASHTQRTPLFSSRACRRQARHTQPGRSLICARDNGARQTSPHRGMHSCTIRAEPVQPLSWVPQARNQTHPEGERHAGIFVSLGMKQLPGGVRSSALPLRSQSRTTCKLSACPASLEEA